jgi:hypothetical protein
MDYIIRYRKEAKGIKAEVYGNKGIVYITTRNNTKEGALAEAMQWIGDDYQSITEE